MSVLNKEHDPEELFLLSLGPMFKSLTSEKRGKTKIELLTVLHRAQLTSVPDL